MLKGCLILLALFAALIMAGIVGAIVTAAHLHSIKEDKPRVERNQWGQVPMTHEEMCKATILQWSKKCADI